MVVQSRSSDPGEKKKEKKKNAAYGVGMSINEERKREI